MKEKVKIPSVEIEREYERLFKEAEEGGYHLNPDKEFTKALVEGLLVNTRRYGYPSCPCRLASGKKEEDLDIICPCDYRDADLNDYGTCYCGLYVTREIIEGKLKLKAIPDRRKKLPSGGKDKMSEINIKLAYPVWRCKVCGYLCSRENPPEECPICKAKKERFEKFLEVK